MAQPLFPRQKTEQGVRRSREAWFSRLAGLFARPRLDEGVWEEAEELLLGADVGVATTRWLLDRVRERARRKGVGSPEAVFHLLKEEMVGILTAPETRPLLGDGSPSPLVVLMVGANGVGKTTSLAKLAFFLRAQGKRVLLGAADTFRAAAIEQLQAWGERVGAEVVAQRPGADSAAVAYDAVQAARARGLDAVLIDTAGRLHTKHNLMEELRKVRRVLARLDPSAPHQTLLVLDATTGQNGLAQARSFTEAVGCTGVFLAKLDGTAKGGIVLAVCHQLGLPVSFIGTGERPEDIAPFDPRGFVDLLFTQPASPRESPAG